MEEIKYYLAEATVMLRKSGHELIRSQPGESEDETARRYERDPGLHMEADNYSWVDPELDQVDWDGPWMEITECQAQEFMRGPCEFLQKVKKD